MRKPRSKKETPLWRISISTTPEAEDAVSNALEDALGESAVSYTDVETNETCVSVYTGTKPNRAALEPRLKAQLAAIQRCGLNTRPARISIAKIRREDWAESWKRHFKPIAIGRALLIKPSWIKRRPLAKQAVIILDPGLSFGTGQHPTTSFCLQQVVAARARFKAATPSLLDIGTGSGVLAIAATKLGFAPVEAFDFDPESVRVAAENARTNDVADQLKMRQADLTKLPKRGVQFDVVCANLISTLLIAERDRIVNRLKPGGVLILAGILKSEFHLVETAFSEHRLKLVASKAEKEWRSGAFTSTAAPPRRRD